MLAQVTITPVGTGEELKEMIAKAVAIIEKSELDYQLTSMGTIIEGDWDEIMVIVKKCHDEITNFADRVVTNIVIDDRKDLQNRLKNNVLEVEYALGKDLKTNGLT
ncbi:MTH1187 family thiamine-binding protein [candidate division KSB1 bacterium]|nr:MTH1187 family thiamine-binding protein [candidate division KSB1 bacterium]